jgi:hypothetical protein
VWIGQPKASHRPPALHLAHPLVRAAIDEARDATQTTQHVELASEAGPLSGARGWVRVSKVRRDGLEPVEQLVAVGTRWVGDAVEPLDPEAIDALLSGELRTVEGEPPADAPSEALEDALEEAMFLAEADLEAAEATHFEERLERLERFVEDRLLVLSRRLHELTKQRTEAEHAREAALAPATRERAEERLRRVAERLEQLEAEVDRLRRREDERYTALKEALYLRRFAPPTIETLFEMSWRAAP